MTPMHDLLGPNPTLLPGDPDAEAQLAAGDKPTAVAAAHPSASVAWAALAEDALADDKVITAYAYARTGYHRGLDQLRRNGWKGFGPVPFSHEPWRRWPARPTPSVRPTSRPGAWICWTTVIRVPAKASA